MKSFIEITFKPDNKFSMVNSQWGWKKTENKIQFNATHFRNDSFCDGMEISKFYCFISSLRKQTTSVK